MKCLVESIEHIYPVSALHHHAWDDEMDVILRKISPDTWNLLADSNLKYPDNFTELRDVSKRMGSKHAAFQFEVPMFGNRLGLLRTLQTLTDDHCRAESLP